MNVLGIFARRPESGRTKTRLAASIGNDKAAELYAAFLEDLLSRTIKRQEQCVVAVTPRDTNTETWFQKHISGNSELHFQPDGNLGDRIQWFFETAFTKGAKRVVLIGSDSPDIPDSIIDQAFERLTSTDLVLAPAADGGYVLIGLSCQVPKLFENIPWSAAITLTETISAARQNRLRVELLPPWYDIDTVDNLGTLFAMQQTAGSVASTCPQTFRHLESIWPQIQQSMAAQDSGN